MESQIKESSEHIHKDSSDQEKYEINCVSQRNDSCVIDSQVPTCSKYTTDPDYHVRKDYDQRNKVFPESQESSDMSRNIINTNMAHNIQYMATSNEHQANKCYYCDRVLKSIGGMKLHMKSCKGKLTNCEIQIKQTNSNKENLSLRRDLFNKSQHDSKSAENHALTSYVTVISETNVMPKRTQSHYEVTLESDLKYSNDDIETAMLVNMNDIPIERETIITPNLPSYKRCNEITSSVTINNTPGDRFEHLINSAYNETIFWRKNLFMLFGEKIYLCFLNTQWSPLQSSKIFDKRTNILA